MIGRSGLKGGHSLDDIVASKIRDKARNMRTVYGEARQMKPRSVWGLPVIGLRALASSFEG